MSSIILVFGLFCISQISKSERLREKRIERGREEKEGKRKRGRKGKGGITC